MLATKYSYIGSSVHLQVSIQSTSKRSAVILQGVPVVTVESLPLWRSVGIPESGHLLGAVKEVGLGNQVTLGEEVVIGQVNVLLSQGSGS